MIKIGRSPPTRWRQQISGNYDFTSPYDRRLLMMRLLEGVNAKTVMAEDVDQVVGLGGRTIIILRYAEEG